MRLLDGGFESGGIGTPWDSSGPPYAVFTHVDTGDPVRTGIYSFKLGAEFLIGSALLQVIPTTPGETLALAGWFNADQARTPLRFFVDPVTADGSNLVEIEVFHGNVVPGWMSHIFPPVVAAGPAAMLYWTQFAPGSPGGESKWYLDDFLLVGDEDVAKRSRWLAHQRLVTVLKGINGASGGYHVDLANRVFTKYVKPLGGAAPPLPYLCVPLVNSSPKVEHGSTWIRHEWTIPIIGFVSESNLGATDSDSIALLYHLGEDVYQAVMRDPYLNNTVQEASFGSGALEEAGISPFDGLQYGDAIWPLRLAITFGLDVLGP